MQDAGWDSLGVERRENRDREAGTTTQSSRHRPGSGVASSQERNETRFVILEPKVGCAMDGMAGNRLNWGPRDAILVNDALSLFSFVLMILWSGILSSSILLPLTVRNLLSNILFYFFSWERETAREWREERERAGEGGEREELYFCPKQVT